MVHRAPFLVIEGGPFWPPLLRSFCLLRALCTRLPKDTIFRQTERFLRTLSVMISMYISHDHRNWDIILPFVSFAYNTALQCTTGYSRFFLVFGQSPSYTFTSTLFSDPVCLESPSHEQYILCSPSAENKHVCAPKLLGKSERPDTTRRIALFVFTQAMKCSSRLQCASRVCEKFLQRFLDPYVVLEETSAVNYHVTPIGPVRDRRHRCVEIFHVSRLKPLGATPQTYSRQGGRLSRGEGKCEHLWPMYPCRLA